ncbi:MAG: hypothetical protein ABIQ64_01180 [Candidatus Saccharimonadales bacterium]
MTLGAFATVGGLICICIDLTADRIIKEIRRAATPAVTKDKASTDNN